MQVAAWTGFIRRYQLEVAISFRAESPSDKLEVQADPFRAVNGLRRYVRRAEQSGRRRRVVRACPTVIGNAGAPFKSGGRGSG